MVTPELLEYIENTLNSGQDRYQITKTLLDNGWDQNVISQAFLAIDNVSGVPVPPPEDRVQETVAKSCDPQYYSDISAFNLFKIVLAFFKSAPLLLLIGIIINTASQLISTYLIPSIYRLSANFLIVSLLAASFWLISILILQFLSVFLIKKFKNRQSSFTEILSYFRKNLIPFLLMNLSIMITTAFGLVLLIIPGIIFAFWAYFSLFVYIEEGLPVLSSIDKSRFYSRGHIVGKIICKSLFLILVTIIFSIPVGILGYINNTLKTIFSFILYGAVSSITCIYFYNFYLNIKCQKENQTYSPKKSTFFIYKFFPIIGLILALFVSVVFNKTITSFINSSKATPSESQQETNNKTSGTFEPANRAKDASTQNDATEVLGAYERYYANFQEYPWVRFHNNPPLTIDSAVIFDSTQAGFGICYSDTATTSATDVGVCNSSGSKLGTILLENELSSSFAAKDPFKNPGSNGENKFWVLKTPGSTGVTDGYIYVCFIPKSEQIKSDSTKLSCLNNTVNPPVVTPVGTDGCVAPSANSAWSKPVLDGLTGMFRCLPH